MLELFMSSKSPAKKTERWEPPNKMQRMNPASGGYHNKTLPKRFHLDHRKSSLKYTKFTAKTCELMFGFGQKKPFFYYEQNGNCVVSKADPDKI